MSKPTFYRLFGKRAFDLFFSGLLLLLLAPLMLILAGCVRLKLGSPIIFKQTRPGKNEQLFFMYKFRTMTDEKDQHGAYLPDDRLFFFCFPLSFTASKCVKYPTETK